MQISSTNALDERHAQEIANLAAVGALPHANLSMQDLGGRIARLVEVER